MSRAGAFVAMAVLFGAVDCQAANWAALTTDRVATRVGDTLTVLIFENATASNSAQNGSSRNTRAAARLSSGVSHSEGGDINVGGAYSGQGQSGRTDKMVASISVTVTGSLPNGDLQVAGEQALNINREQTTIRVSGRVRRADISPDNTVLSTRLADSHIDYTGAGFVAQSARPGLIGRALGKLGLF